MKRRIVLGAAVTIALAAVLGGCKKEEPPAPKAAEAPRAPEAVTVRIGSA